MSTKSGGTRFQGARGHALRWLLTEEQLREYPAGIDTWTVFVPGAHPMWQYYMVAACALRDVPGLSPAHRQFAEATHEFLVWALDPEFNAHYDTNGRPPVPAGKGFLLSPANLVHQVRLNTDEDARRVLELLVRSFCDGVLSPDTDFRSAQIAALNATASHYRAGEHLPTPAPPVDHSARDVVGTAIAPGVPDTTDRGDGQQKGYVVLSDAERAKGFVRPVRRSYRHVGKPGSTGCGSVTTMGQSIAETYARSPTFYSGTFCASCGSHFPVGADGQFVWLGTDERVGT